MDTTGQIGKKVRKKTKGKPFLPDDIIPNILCRLPAKNVSQCRIVCRTWRDLTLTRDFVDLNFRHTFPMILVANPIRYTPEVNHLLLDKWWEPARRKLMIHTFPFDHENNHSRYLTLFSHAGLIVFRKSLLLDFIIYNPINLEKVTISIPRELILSEIYGVFFHPSLKEYCSLWRIEVSDDTYGKSIPIQYKMLNLGSSPFMKTICNPFTHRVRRRYDNYPLFIDKYLYWILEAEQKHGYKYSGRSDIMQFDIISEEFSVKPCPIPVDREYPYSQTYLLNIDGSLSFLVIFPFKFTIWRLEDHAEQLWAAANFSFGPENLEFIPEPIAVVDGNLALFSQRRLLVYNLMQGTMKCFRNKQYDCGVLVLSHQMSLASLKNCQSAINLDEKGEVDVREYSSISHRHSSAGSNEGSASTEEGGG